MPELIDWRSVAAEPDALLATWHLTQQASVALYRENRDDSCADSARVDVAAVREFVDMAGKRVIDIGSGAFVRPGYVADDVGEYVGIDPIVPDAAPDFELINAFAEQLPFPDHHFDVVFFATSLDHVLHVPSALGEASRVLSPGGSIYFWGGISTRHDDYREIVDGPVLARDQAPTSGSVTSAEARCQLDSRLERLGAAGADFEHLLLDAFHVRHFPIRDLIGLFFDAGFVAARSEPIVMNHDIASMVIEFVRVDRVDSVRTALAAAAGIEFDAIRATAQAEFHAAAHHEVALGEVNGLRTEIANRASVEAAEQSRQAARVDALEAAISGLRSDLVAKAEVAEISKRIEELESQVGELETAWPARLAARLERLKGINRS